MSKKIAFAVAKKAIEEGVALEITDEALQLAIESGSFGSLFTVVTNVLHSNFY